MTTETAAWLADLKAQGNLDDTTYNALKTSLESNPTADNFVKGSQLRQADYSRAMADTQKAVADLKIKEDTLTTYQADLGVWKQGADRDFQKAIQDREAAERKVAAAVARLRTTAVQAGINEDDVLRDLDVVPPVVPPGQKEAPVDTSKFITREQASAALTESAMIDAAIYDIAAEYQELTGKPLRDAAKLVQEAITAKVPLSQFAARKFDFDKLRADKAEAGIQARITEAVSARETQLRSDAALQGGGARPLGRSDLKGSPILGHEFKTPEGPTPSGGGISAAVAAFNQGTYKVGAGR